ncbi:MAG: YjbQ family protein [Thermodesulfobacteria bacterium]|nr:YjbQ family protein [Thermodesulfobacteriota bacterium]
MEVITVRTNRQTELVDITDQVARLVSGVKSGICYLYCPHTTAGLVINEGADPAVAEDVISVLNHFVPWKFGYKHLEGNSPAHVKACLTGPGTFVFVEDGRLKLGTWQRIFFAEYDGPRTRKVYVKVVPD